MKGVAFELHPPSMAATRWNCKWNCLLVQLLLIAVVIPSSSGDEKDLDTLVPLVIWHGMGERV